MHNNYYFLRQLTNVLRKELTGYFISSCFSQEKDELIIELTKQDRLFYIKATFTSHFSALSFPTVFNRARANSTNLFKELIGLEITGLTQFKNERAFALHLENSHSLLFKLFGNRANIIHFQEGNAQQVFQKKFPQDVNINLSELNRDLIVDKNDFLNQKISLAKRYPTFGDIPEKYLMAHHYQEASPENQWKMVQELISQLENPQAFYLSLVQGQIRLLLLPVGKILETYSDPVLACQEFVRYYLTQTTFEKNYQQAQQLLIKKIAGAATYINDLETKILELEYDTSLSQTADLIMANLTNIPDNALQVEVYNFYTNQQIIIDLPQKYSPQKFAERLYKKNKNRRIEVIFLKERYEIKKLELARLQNLNSTLQAIQTNIELKVFLKENPVQSQAVPLASESLFREFYSEGYKIMVGKNAKNNDLLTQQHTHKDDLWLHAKDVSGSHVVIKLKAGKPVPEPVIEKAAQLAAWYSKRKNDSLCPVLYTPKKYVRKPKGAAPGAVFVEREKVILVRPQNPFSQYPGLDR